MPTAVKSRVSPQFREELRYFIQNNLCRLLGLTGGRLQEDLQEFDDVLPTILQEEAAESSDKTSKNTLYFSIGTSRLFKMRLGAGSKLTEDNIKLARRIIQEFLKVSKYKRDSSGVQNAYYPKEDSKPIEFGVYRREMYERAIEKGICRWVVGDYPGSEGSDNYVEELFSILKKWSVKTYEGKSVTLGFVINPDVETTYEIPGQKWSHFMQFIKDDAAAVLTDCIHSVFELDRNCNLIRHISVSEGNRLEFCDLDYRIPLRFTQIIKKHVGGKKVGIFLLSNGDLVLAKNGEMRFVKRNLQWLNLSYDAFQYAMRPFTEKYPVQDDKLIQSVFASVLDVSFSHAGGIIAVVNTAADRAPVFDWSILNDFDNLYNTEIDPELWEKATCELLEEEIELKAIHTEFAEKRKKQSRGSDLDEEEQERLDATHKEFEVKRKEQEDVRKRFLKQKVLRDMVCGTKFWLIDRKLRNELISLDGACILNCNGEVISCGAIIQNDSGSSAGGRGAAAKKLSKYGMAVKISTDGYIEVYYETDVVYEIK